MERLRGVVDHPLIRDLLTRAAISASPGNWSRILPQRWFELLPQSLVHSLPDEAYHGSAILSLAAVQSVVTIVGVRLLVRGVFECCLGLLGTQESMMCCCGLVTVSIDMKGLGKSNIDQNICAGQEHRKRRQQGRR
jgi:hypothetical protein